MADNVRAKEGEAVESTPDRIRFDYIKSNFFRVVHADGVIGGVTPHFDIHMDVWSGRLAIPKTVVHELKPGGEMGSEIREEREVRDAVVREVEVGIVFNIGLAKAMVRWLQEKIDFVEEAREKMVEKQETGE